MRNTTWYNLNKPKGTDAVNVGDFNENFDTVDLELHKAQLTSDNQADSYSDAAAYSVGDLVIYGSRLYICTTDITTPEAWNVEHWKATTIAAVMAELRNVINHILDTNGQEGKTDD